MSESIGRILAVCISEKKGQQKHPVDEVRLLPEHGIELIEIPRLEAGAPPDAVSASRVRELIKRGDLESVRGLVPETTFEIIETIQNKRD